MDLGEKLFGIFSNWSRKRSDKAVEAQTYFFESLERGLPIVLQPFFEDVLEIHQSARPGLIQSQIFLPEKIHIFNNPDLNRLCYLHSALILAAAHRGNYYYSANDSDYQRALSLALRIPQLLEEIHRIYPAFSELHQLIKDRFIEYAASKKTAAMNRYQSFLWDSFSGRKTQDEIRVMIKSHLKANEPVSSEIWHVWGGLKSETDRSSAGTQLDSRQRERKQKSKSDHKIATHFERKNVDLSQQPENPVTHSFEKLETADEYSGGSRTADGSDQLDDHANALKELKIDKVTRSGESSAAFISSDFTMQADQISMPASTPSGLEFVFYPEWNYQKNRFQENFCRLEIHRSKEKPESDFANVLKERHGTRIQKYRDQLLQLCNQKKWRNQLTDGCEIDLDAAVRHLSDLKNKITPSGKLYRNQFNREREYQVVILIDTSLSTDSYVDNRRILDVALESVGLIGLIAEPLGDQTLVACANSETRHHCAFEVLKDTTESWGHYYARAPLVEPKGYTRLGPSLRHATKILAASKAQKKILILLTDGKPTDYDGYEGRYGIEDMRKACLEAQMKNIYTKAFAIEKNAKHYFPHMFGHFEILPRPEKLPEALVRTYFQAHQH